MLCIGVESHWEIQSWSRFRSGCSFLHYSLLFPGKSRCCCIAVFQLPFLLVSPSDILIPHSRYGLIPIPGKSSLPSTITCPHSTLSPLHSAAGGEGVDSGPSARHSCHCHLLPFLSGGLHQCPGHLRQTTLQEISGRQAILILK